MKRKQANLELIEIVAEALGELCQQCVFVGGSIIGLLVTDPAIRDVRATDDVDVVVQVASYAKYAQFQELLRARGFQHVMDGPNCRFKINETIVDVMPSEESILGFHNKWYPLIFEKPLGLQLTQKLSILVVDPALFLCSKLEAFHDRGKSDYVMSHDIEDAITILYGRYEIFMEICKAAKEARDYLNKEFKQMLADELFLEALPGMIQSGPLEEDLLIKQRMQVIINCACSDEWLAANLGNLEIKSFANWQHLEPFK